MRLRKAGDESPSLFEFNSAAIRMRLEEHALDTVDAVDEITRESATK